jgi:hypothetical protein
MRLRLERRIRRSGGLVDWGQPRSAALLHWREGHRDVSVVHLARRID